MIVLENLDYNEALRYMGHKGEIDSTLNTLLQECAFDVLKTARPSYTYKIVRTDEKIFVGKDIKEHLKGCSSAIMLGGTIGFYIDKLIAKYQITDMQKAVIVNSLSSVAVEQLMDKIEVEIRERYKEKFFTFRFSPGYGDYPVECQREFVKIIDGEKKIGIHTDESGMLIPSKSVTAVIGISDTKIDKQKRGCSTCNMRETCNLRKNGEHCGS